MRRRKKKERENEVKIKDVKKKKDKKEKKEKKTKVCSALNSAQWNTKQLCSVIVFLSPVFGQGLCSVIG